MTLYMLGCLLGFVVIHGLFVGLGLIIEAADRAADGRARAERYARREYGHGKL